jgi:hypothetical protein
MNKINIRQIYHTSHCGSTLMATLLTNSTVVYAEPSWIHNLIQNDKLVGELTDNTVIKFQSSFCHYSGHLSGKKVFLYRKLKHHLYKIKTSNYTDSIISSKYEYHLHHCHPSLKEYQFDSDLEKIVFIWLNIIQWISDTPEILWIETNSFLSNKKETIVIVCDHFEIDRVKNFDLSNFYVKSFGLLGKETSINEADIPHLGEMKTLYPSYGIVEDDLCDQYPEILDLMTRAKEEFFYLDKNLLE